MQRFVNLDQLTAELKKHVSIQKLVAEELGVPQTISGDNAFYWCPFHGEKNKPSLAVNDKMMYFRCFGCQKNGDIFEWMEERHNEHIFSAIEILAQRYGFELRQYVRAATAEEAAQDRLYYIYSVVAESCHATLFGYPEIWNSYAAETKFTQDQARPYKVGYSNSSSDLVNLLYSKIPGLTNDEVNKLELTNATMWDHAWTYPVHNASGQVVSFRNKPLAGAAAGKYIGTSKNHPLFEEGVVYGLYQVKKDIRAKDGRIVIVEGQKASIATGSGAVMGTNFTEKQVETLKKYGVKQVTVVFDGDQAGYEASLRLLDEFRAYQGILLKIGQPPLGKQPDTVMNELGSTAWQAIVDSAQLPVEFYISNKMVVSGQLTLEQKYRIIYDLANFLKLLSGLEADITADYLAKKLEVDVEHVKVYIQSLRSQDAQLSNIKAEMSVLFHIISAPPNFATAKQQSFEPATFVNPAHQWIFKAISNCYDKYQSLYTPQTIRDELKLVKPNFVVEACTAMDNIMMEEPAYDLLVAIQKVADLWRRRQAITESSSLSNSLRDLNSTTEGAIQTFRRKLTTAVQIYDHQANTPQQLAEKSWKEMLARGTRPGGVIGADFSNGGQMHCLNTLLSGLQPGHLTVIAANQGAGKSILALNMIKPIAIDQRIPWLWIPQEMTDNETMFRLLSLISGVDNNKIQRGIFSNKEEFDRVEEAHQQIYKGKLYCYKPQTGSADEIFAVIDDYRFRYGIVGVTWDYIQLVAPSKEQHGMKDAEIIANASRMMKNDVAERMKICALVIAQLNRDNYKEGEIRSGEHMGGAYRISQDCDDMATIYEKTPDQIAEDGAQRGNRKVFINKRRGGQAKFMLHVDIDTYDKKNLQYRERMTDQEIVGLGNSPA